MIRTMQENLNTTNPNPETPEMKDARIYLDKIIEHTTASKLSRLERESLHKKEQDFKEKTKYVKVFEKLIERYGAQADLEHLGNKLFEMHIHSDISDLVPELPEGYAFMGGAVRSIVMRELGIHANIPPRDLDIVRVGENRTQDKELSEKYMPEDASHGYGLKKIRDDYFNTRDFTINEALYYDGKVYLTKECILDMLRGIIRFTDDRKIKPEKKLLRQNYQDDDYDGEDREDEVFDDNGERIQKDSGEPYYIIDTIILPKALRLCEEMKQRGLNFTTEEEPYTITDNISIFQIAVHLRRAMESGPKVVEGYLDRLTEKEIIPPEIRNLEMLMRYISKYTSGIVFRHAPTRQLTIEEELLVEYADREPGKERDMGDLFENHMAEKYEMLPFNQSMRRGEK